MKKIFVLAAMMLFVAGSASAAALATATVSAEGAAIYAGTTATNATNASYPMVKLSSGVAGVVNFNSSDPVSYAIVTKHSTGSKIFGTANDSTTIYWKQDAAGILTASEAGSASDDANFSSGWTSY